MDFRWFQPLHVKKLSGKIAQKIIRRISQNHFEKDAWLIVLPFGEHNLFDIYPAYVFLQESFPCYRADVIGLAKSRGQAVELAAELVQEVYQATGGFDTRTYYRSKMQWTDCREA